MHNLRCSILSHRLYLPRSFKSQHQQFSMSSSTSIPNPDPDISLSSNPSNTPIKILFLHGYTQTGPSFSSKTGALRKALISALAPRPVQVFYPSGPILLSPEDIPGYEARESDRADGAPGDDQGRGAPDEHKLEAYGWWRRKDPRESNPGGATRVLYSGLDQGLAVIAREIKTNGPFDGVVGFSQGACAAGLVASLLDDADGKRRRAFEELAAETKVEEERVPFPQCFLDEHGVLIQRPFRFVVCYSGFRAAEVYQAFYSPTIDVPSLHVLGGLDTVVDEDRSLQLADGFEESRRSVVTHPGGHFVPSGKVWLNAVVSWIQKCLKE